MHDRVLNVLEKPGPQRERRWLPNSPKLINNEKKRDLLGMELAVRSSDLGLDLDFGI